MRIVPYAHRANFTENTGICQTGNCDSWMERLLGFYLHNTRILVYIGSAEKHLVSSQIADIISLNINSLAPEGSQSARFCGAPPAKACRFAWRFC